MDFITVDAREDPIIEDFRKDAITEDSWEELIIGNPRNDHINDYPREDPITEDPREVIEDPKEYLLGWGPCGMHLRGPIGLRTDLAKQATKKKN